MFCHGYALNLDCWHFQRDALRGRYRMAFYDQRSHGRSERSSKENVNIDQLGDDLEAERLEIGGIEHPVDRRDRHALASERLHGGGSALPLHAPTHQFCAVPAHSLFVHKYFRKYSKKLFILGKKCGKVKTCQMWSIPHHNKYICRVGRAYPGAKRGL